MKKKNYGKRTKMRTTFSSKCEILGDLWMNYRDDETLQDFIEYNDLGLPLAYMITNGIATSTETGVSFVDEAFDLLVAALQIEDTGFETLDQMFDVADSL